VYTRLNPRIRSSLAREVVALRQDFFSLNMGLVECLCCDVTVFVTNQRASLRLKFVAKSVKESSDLVGRYRLKTMAQQQFRKLKNPIGAHDVASHDVVSHS